MAAGTGGTWSVDDLNGLAQLVAFLALVCAGGTAWGILKAKISEHAVQLKIHREQIAAQAKELSEHRERVARDYVSHEHLAGLEARLVGAIDRLGDRFDKFFDTFLQQNRKSL